MIRMLRQQQDETGRGGARLLRFPVVEPNPWGSLFDHQSAEDELKLHTSARSFWGVLSSACVNYGPDRSPRPDQSVSGSM
jgi:hypothetical protein